MPVFSFPHFDAVPFGEELADGLTPGPQPRRDFAGEVSLLKVPVVSRGSELFGFRSPPETRYRPALSERLARMGPIQNFTVESKSNRISLGTLGQNFVVEQRFHFFLSA